MNYLLLVRHSLPAIRLDVPAAQWELSAVGRQRCEPLAERLRAYAPTVVITSVERKADQTGAIVAQKLGIPATVLEGFHEHERDKAGPASREAFEAMLARFFVQPSKLLFGCETAEQALQRFSGAMATVLARYPSENVAIVSHGTVITLWVTSLIGGDPFVFWKGLGMPSFVVFSKPDLKLVELVRYVE